MQISFSVLGPMTAELRPAEAGDCPVELDAGPFKQRLLLALLLCRCNSVVLVEQLIDALWWEGPPRTAHKNIQVYISHLRKLLSADGRPTRLRYRPPGYQLVLTPAEVDALQFEDLSRAGRLALRRGDARTAAASMRQALGLWRGPALADLQLSPALREEGARFDDRRLSVYEDWFEAELVLGNHGEVLDQIEGVVRAHPLRERLRSQQLTALYHGGRQVEALAEYDNHRQLLAAELGLDPSPALRRLYQNILSGHPALNAPLSAVGMPSANLTIPSVSPASPVPSASLGSPASAGSPAVAAGVSPEPDPEVVAHVAAPTPPRPPLSGLPRATDDFTGRQNLLGEILAYFGQRPAPGAGDADHLRRFAAIVGPPGSGTSTLALQAAHALAPQFRDGPVLLPLRDERGAPRPPDELVDDLLARLDLRPAARDRSTLLRSRLADLQLLLILDGAVDEAQVRPLLPGAGDCSVIVTSCRRLGSLDGVQRFLLGTFTEEEALELLGRLIGPERVAGARPAALRIVRACGLLPLAVRIAGARLAGLDHLPLDRFAARLEDADRMLDELAAGDLSVRDCFDRYSNGLEAAERLALMQVAVAWGPPSRGPSEMEQLLERLVGVHALTITDQEFRAASPVPFAMPAPLWVYAQRLLVTAVSDARP